MSAGDATPRFTDALGTARTFASETPITRAATRAMSTRETRSGPPRVECVHFRGFGSIGSDRTFAAFDFAPRLVVARARRSRKRRAVAERQTDARQVRRRDRAPVLVLEKAHRLGAFQALHDEVGEERARDVAERRPRAGDDGGPERDVPSGVLRR